MDDETRKVLHALNNALSIVSTFAAALADDTPADDPRRESVDEILRASRQAAALAKKLLDPQG